jgi:hypothetical protein
MPTKNTEQSVGFISRLFGSDLLKQGEFEWGVVSETGMVFKAGTPETEWKRITEDLCLLFERSDKTHSQCAMMLGDALRFGEEQFGERYADVIDATRDYMRARGIEQSKNWMWVAGKIPPHRRHINLSFGHHELVAKLEGGEQDKFLNLAENEGLTVRELRGKIREEHPGKPRKDKTAVKTADNAKSALQKLIDVSNFVSENPKDALTEKWKGPLLKLHLAFRRKWQDGRKK